MRSDGWFEDEDTVFITMEYIEHGDLQRHLTRCLPEVEALQVIAQVHEGLGYMHRNGFVHRDLKPGVGDSGIIPRSMLITETYRT